MQELARCLPFSVLWQQTSSKFTACWIFWMICCDSWLLAQTQVCFRPCQPWLRWYTVYAMVREQLGLFHSRELEQMPGSKTYLNQTPDLAMSVGSTLATFGKLLVISFGKPHVKLCCSELLLVYSHCNWAPLLCLCSTRTPLSSTPDPSPKWGEFLWLLVIYIYWSKVGLKLSKQG